MDENDFWRDCPKSEQDSDKLHGRPTVGPYRVAAQTVAEGAELGETPEEIADEFGLPLDKVRAVLRYYHSRKAEPTLGR